MNKIENLKIIDLFDNVSFNDNSDLKSAWGYSLYIEIDRFSILFDTGSDGNILINNMKKLSVHPEKINIVVISHLHHDHTGGIIEFCKHNNHAPLYVLSSISKETKEHISSYTKHLTKIASIHKIYDNVYLFPFLQEQVLAFNTIKGVVIICGCAHPVLINIIKEIKTFFGREIYLVMGGFHYKNYSSFVIEEKIRSFRKLKVKKVAPSHCSGEKAISKFKEEYKEDFIQFGLGKILSV